MEQCNKSAAVYVRISRDAEGTEAGVERQEADCRALAERMGLPVVRVFTDNDIGASVKSKKARPSYRAMLEAVRAGEVAVVLAYSNSRITRRPMDWEELMKLSESHGLEVHTVVSSSANFATADGKMILRYLAANDAAEADRISERVTRAKLQNVEQGTYRGGPRPFGYQDGGMELHGTEADAVRDASRRLLAGESLRSIAADLTAHGFTGTRATDKPLSAIQLRDILLRARNAGLMEHRGKITGPAVWPAILDESVWQAVRSILTDPSRRTNAGSSVLKHLGSSTYCCGRCGAKLKASRSSGGYLVYRCRDHAHLARRMEPIDELVRDVVVLRLRKAGLTLLSSGRATDQQAEALRDRITGLRARRERLPVDYADGLMDGHQLKAAGERIDAQLSEAVSELGVQASTSSLADVVKAPDPGDAFLNAAIGKQRAVLNALVTVTVHPGRRGRPEGWNGGPYLDPQSIHFDWKAGSAD